MNMTNTKLLMVVSVLIYQLLISSSDSHGQDGDENIRILKTMAVFCVAREPIGKDVFPHPKKVFIFLDPDWQENPRLGGGFMHPSSGRIVRNNLENCMEEKFSYQEFDISMDWKSPSKEAVRTWSHEQNKWWWDWYYWGYECEQGRCDYTQNCHGYAHGLGVWIFSHVPGKISAPVDAGLGAPAPEEELDASMWGADLVCFPEVAVEEAQVATNRRHTIRIDKVEECEFPDAEWFQCEAYDFIEGRWRRCSNFVIRETSEQWRESGTYTRNQNKSCDEDQIGLNIAERHEEVHDLSKGEFGGFRGFKFRRALSGFSGPHEPGSGPHEPDSGSNPPGSGANPPGSGANPPGSGAN